MGFSYVIYNGKQYLSCDFCGGFIKDGHTKSVVKKPCPFGYCQAYATCNICNSKNNRELHIKEMLG